MDLSLQHPSARLRRILSLCILIPALVAAGLMTAAFFTQYDAPDANYFARGAVLPVIACVCAALSALVGTVSALLLPRGSLQQNSLPIPSASLDETIGFLFCAIFLAVSLVRDGSGLLRLIPLILSLIAVVYTLTVSFGKLSDEKTRRVAVPLGFSAVFAAIFLCAVHYFDRSLEMNAPCKVFLLLGLLAATVCFTGEIRYLIGIASPRVYLMLLSWTVAAGALSIPAIPAAHFAGILSKTDYIASAFAVLGCLLTSAIRLWFFLGSNTDKPEETETDAQEDHTV